MKAGRAVGDAPVAAGSWRRRVFGEEGLVRYVFLLPAAFMILCFAVPVGLTLVWSVFERTQFWMEPGFTLFAYETFFTSARAENFSYAMVHAAVAVVVSFVLGFPIAVFVRRRVPVSIQHRVILLFILPFMISELIRVFALRPVLARHGLVNEFLLRIGIIDTPISAILFTPLGVIIGDVMSFLPFMVFSGFLAMEAVQRYVFEVCDDLGVGLLRTFKSVILPLAAPGIFAGSVFIFVNGLGVGLIPNILGGPGAVNAGSIVFEAIVALDFPLAMAVSAIMTVTLVALLWIGHWLFDLTRVLEPIS